MKHHANGAEGSALRAVFTPENPSGELPFRPDAPWLAPMAGYTDLPFRLLCRRLGAAAAVTEMVSAKGLALRQPGTEKMLAATPEDAPLAVQLFGAEAEVLAEAVRVLLDRGAQFIDLNAGCPVRKVGKSGAGASLLRDMDHAARLLEAMAKAAGRAKVGIKLRPGYEMGDTAAIEAVPRLESAGAAWMALHPRFGKQMFSGSVRLDLLAEFAARASVPVLGSGDLFSPAAGADMIRATGVAGVMYARGALADPAIFAKHAAMVRGEPAPPGLPSTGEIIREHVRLLRSREDSQRTLRRMRSIVPRYIRELRGARALRQRLTRCASFEELEQIIAGLEEAMAPSSRGRG